jgi:hypothetical protein
VNCAKFAASLTVVHAAAVAPLPAGVALFAPVCVPFYRERGPSLRRSLEALVLQMNEDAAEARRRLAAA